MPICFYSKRLLNLPFFCIVGYWLTTVVAQAGVDPMIGQLFNTTDFPERWHCGNWTSFHGWTHIVSDLVVWVAYTSIPIALLVIVRRKRSVLPYPFLWVMFSLFIISCGLTHLMEAFIFWWPAYRVLGVLKVITAVISAATAIALLPKLSRILSLKTVEASESEVRQLTEQFEENKNLELAAHYKVLESIVEDSLSGYWDWNIKEGTEYLSEQLIGMLGYRINELGSGPGAWKQLLPLEQRDLADAVYARHVATKAGEAYDLTLEFTHKDGHVVHIIRRGHITEWDQDGNPVRMVGCHIDVSPLIEAEQALEARNEQLEMVAKGINAGIWDWDVTTGEIWWSPRYYELLGYENNAFPSSYEVFIQKVLHPDDKTSMEARIAQHLDSHQPYRMDLRLMCKDGQYRWFDTFGAAAWDASGNAVRMVGSIIDIELRKQLEARDKESICMLTEQNKRLVSFAHIISHNLRSSSGNMVALLSMLASEDDATIQKEVIGHLEKCANQLHETIEHLTRIVRIQTEVNRETEMVSFQEILGRVQETLSEEISEVNLNIQTDFSALPEIDYVPSYLESIFLNLLSNSIRYRDPRRPLKVEIESRLEGDDQTLIFTDNGLGIDLKKEGQKVFGLYKTFHSNPEARGVGLFLIKNQIEALNGRIHIESELGSGTRFTVTF